MSGAPEADGGSLEAGPAGPLQEIHREKPTSTVVRVLTVLAYLLSVSLAAILLSVYYICVWKSPDLPKVSAHEMLSARRGDHNDYDPALTNEIAPYNFTGGSNTTVNETATLPILDKFENFTNTIESAETTMDSSENTTLLPLQETENPYIDAVNTTKDT